jgi:hypothetical protein
MVHYRMFRKAVQPFWRLATSERGGVAHAGRLEPRSSIFSPRSQADRDVMNGQIGDSYGQVESASVSPHSRNLFVTFSGYHRIHNTVWQALYCSKAIFGVKARVTLGGGSAREREHFQK